MLMRLFLGIPLLKGFPLHPISPLVITTFQGKTFIGTRSNVGAPLSITNLDLHYRYTQDLLNEAIPINYKPAYRGVSLMIFPEILIGDLDVPNMETSKKPYETL